MENSFSFLALLVKLRSFVVGQQKNGIVAGGIFQSGKINGGFAFEFFYVPRLLP
jgi:hypothetical protein